MKMFAVLAACAATSAFADHPATIIFAGRIGEQPFACDATHAGLGNSGAVVRAAGLYHHVNDVEVIATGDSRAPSWLDGGNEQARAWQASILRYPPVGGLHSGSARGGREGQASLYGMTGRLQMSEAEIDDIIYGSGK